MTLILKPLGFTHQSFNHLNWNIVVINANFLELRFIHNLKAVYVSFPLINSYNRTIFVWDKTIENMESDS